MNNLSPGSVTLTLDHGKNILRVLDATATMLFKMDRHRHQMGRQAVIWAAPGTQVRLAAEQAG